jgi:hypothetical protein
MGDKKKRVRGAASNVKYTVYKKKNSFNRFNLFLFCHRLVIVLSESIAKVQPSFSKTTTSMPRNQSPQKAHADTRSKHIPGWLSPKEYEELLDRADGDVAEYCRRAVLGLNDPPPPPVPEVNRAIYLELGKISVYFSQMPQLIRQGQVHNFDSEQLESLWNCLKQIQLQVLGMSNIEILPPPA